jgi:hypothetical protein
MTELAQLIWGCQAIKGVDRLVLMGWAEQVADDADVAYCSKTTVGNFLGLSLDTIKRRTQALVIGGWMVDTGERKQWEPDCWTPVYRINLEKLADLDFGGANCTGESGGANKAGVQIAPQGSNSGSRSSSLTYSLALSRATATDLRSVVRQSKEGLSQKPKTQNLKPKTPVKNKTCPKCGVPWSRDKGHFCMENPTPIGDELDDDGLDDSYEPRSLDPDSVEARIEVMEDGLQAHIGRKQGNIEQAASQKTAESSPEEGRATARPKTLHAAPVPPPPTDGCICPLCGDPKEYFDDSCALCYRKQWPTSARTAVPSEL